MKLFRAELHIHTVLSPCAGIEMIPPLIVQEAISAGINLIAITDHNTSYNAKSVIEAAKGSGLFVMPGMELQTEEEVHSLCLFDTLDQLNELQKIVDNKLPDMKNNIEYLGEQFVVDHLGEFIRREERLLITSVNLSIDKAFEIVSNLGGLIIPAHVNREAYGIISHLGFLPPNLNFDALEVSRHLTIQECLERFPQIKGYNLIQSGDVHFLDDFLGANYFNIEKPTIKEIKKALHKIDNRSYYINKSS